MPEIDYIDVYLNGTKDLHNGFDFRDFTVMLEQKVAKTNIARSFGVTAPTVYLWIEKLKALKEQNKNEKTNAKASK